MAFLSLPLLAASAVALAPVPPLEEDPAVIARRARDILARPQFQPAEKSWWQRFVEWLQDLIDPDLPAQGIGGGGGLTQWILIAVLVVVVVFVIWRIARSWTGLPAKESLGDRSSTKKTGRRRSVDEWTAEAKRHEAEGRWSEALRCWYRVLVARLAERDLVRDIPGRTSGEYRDEVRINAPDAAPPFDEASDLFDSVWYGGLPAGPDDAEHLRELSGTVVEAGRK